MVRLQLSFVIVVTGAGRGTQVWSLKRKVVCYRLLLFGSDNPNFRASSHNFQDVGAPVAFNVPVKMEAFPIPGPI